MKNFGLVQTSVFVLSWGLLKQNCTVPEYLTTQITYTLYCP